MKESREVNNRRRSQHDRTKKRLKANESTFDPDVEFIDEVKLPRKKIARKAGSDRNRISKNRGSKATRKVSTRASPRTRIEVKGGRYGSAKALFARNILDINLLRLLGAPIPTFKTDTVFPPSDLGFKYGLADASGKLQIVLSEPIEEKMHAADYFQKLGSLAAVLEYQEDLDLPTQKIYTDGSFYRRYQTSGYAVWWGKENPNNACGPVPTEGPLSSARAEEYAIFLALLQIKAEIMSQGVHSAKYVILTDCLFAKNDILRWFRRWSKRDCAIGWKMAPTSTTQHREILRVAAGLLWDIRFRGAIVELRYVKGHSGVVGNEIADIMAKIGSQTGQFLGPQPLIIS